MVHSYIAIFNPQQAYPCIIVFNTQQAYPSMKTKRLDELVMAYWDDFRIQQEKHNKHDRFSASREVAMD